ncbi:MAG: NINE protein [Saprospiraceae bacterium]|nr:NINE protein [Lewinella sp.]
MKSKQVAGVLALLFGVFGVHRFYLGKRFWGVLHLVAFFMCFGITIASDGEAPFILAPALLGFIDSILLFVMPKEEFDERYNFKYLDRRYEQDYTRPPVRVQRSEPRALPAAPVHSERIFKKRGVEHFRRYNYEAAIENFHEALDHVYEDPITHFNLACCYSRLEEAEDALHHLNEAVAFGFKDIKKIHTHASLAFLRSTPAFENFVNNGYQLLKNPAEPVSVSQPQAAVPQAEPEIITKPEPPVNNLNDDLLDQIVKLGELRDMGILTEEEFSAQKQKMLNS